MSPYIKTSQLICIANQTTGLYMRGMLVAKKVECSFDIKETE